MYFVDSHAHLYLDQFDDDIDAVIQRAMAAGVQRFLLPNIDHSTINSMMKLSNAYPNNCFPMMGLHPCSVKENYESELDVIHETLQKGGFCAVGEIGIDLYWDQSTLKIQKLAFQKQITWAKEHQLPIVIHCRDAFDEIYELVEEANDKQLKGVFHCFTGSLEEAEKVISLGNFKLGIGGVLTFKNAGLDQLLKNIDLKHLLLETDAPYLAPTPHRGKRNESAYISIIAAKLAAVKNNSIEEIARITSNNAKELFGI